MSALAVRAELLRRRRPPQPGDIRHSRWGDREPRPMPHVPHPPVKGNRRSHRRTT